VRLRTPHRFHSRCLIVTLVPILKHCYFVRCEIILHPGLCWAAHDSRLAILETYGGVERFGIISAAPAPLTEVVNNALERRVKINVEGDHFSVIT